MVRIAFANQDVGLIAYDGIIRRTLDAGANWTTVYKGAATVSQLQWAGGDIAFALTSASILDSADQGRHWQVVSSDQNLSRIDFLDGTMGYAVGHDQLVSTKDAGRSFQLISTPIPVEAVEFLSPDQGWVAGPAGIAATSDAGRTWIRQATFDQATDLRSPAWISVHFYDALHGFAFYAVAITVMSQRPSRVFYTDDGGWHWRLQSGAQYYPPLPAASVNTPIWVVGDLVVTGPCAAQVLDSANGGEQPSLAVTADGGVTWTERQRPDAVHPGPLVDGAIAVSGDRAWVIWLDFNGNLARLTMTTDAGRHWTFQNL